MSNTPRTDAAEPKIHTIKGGWVRADFARQLEIELNEVKNWKEAVLQELMVWHLYKLEHETNPKKALNDLASLHSDIAVHIHKEDMWYKKLWRSIRSNWHKLPF